MLSKQKEIYSATEVVTVVPQNPKPFILLPSSQKVES